MNTELKFSLEVMEKMYLVYVNDFLTVGAFANFYGIDERLAEYILYIGRYKYNNYVRVRDTPIDEPDAEEIDTLEEVDDEPKGVQIYQPIGPPDCGGHD